MPISLFAFVSLFSFCVVELGATEFTGGFTTTGVPVLSELVSDFTSEADFVCDSTRSELLPPDSIIGELLPIESITMLPAILFSVLLSILTFELFGSTDFGVADFSCETSLIATLGVAVWTS